MDDEPEERLSAEQFRDQLRGLTFAELATAAAGAAAGVGVAAGAGGLAAASADSTTPGDEQPTSTDATPAGAEGPGRASGTASPRRSRRPLAVLAAVVGLILAVSLVTMFVRDSAASRSEALPGPAAPAGGTSSASVSGEAPSPAASPGTTGPTSSEPTPVPEGFVDCSQQLGPQSYCLTEPECWTDLGNYRDYVSQATMQDCDQPHLYQTYAAGELQRPVASQSALVARAEVQALCSRGNLNKVLGRTSRKDWQIAELGPQVILEDDLFRCLFSTGGFRSTPVKLKTP